jgi:hypothetical protein
MRKPANVCTAISAIWVPIRSCTGTRCVVTTTRDASASRALRATQRPPPNPVPNPLCGDPADRSMMNFHPTRTLPETLEFSSLDQIDSRPSLLPPALKLTFRRNAIAASSDQLLALPACCLNSLDSNTRPPRATHRISLPSSTVFSALFESHRPIFRLPRTTRIYRLAKLCAN